MLRFGIFLLSAIVLASGGIVRPKLLIDMRSPNGKCPDTNGRYPVLLGDTEDCTAFYYCDWGRPIKQHCPPGTSWSQSSNRCDTSEVDKCRNARRKASGRSAVGECPERPGLYPVYLPDSEDCTVFYECDWGRPIKQHCPPGTSWSQTYNRCDTSEVEKCRNSQRKASVRSAVGECPAHDGQYPVYLADDEDCSIFYECSNGRAIKLQCAPGDLFDAPSGKCVKNTDATCQESSKDNKQTIQKNTLKPKPLTAVGECPEQPGLYPVYLPDSEDCTVFYECDWGRPIKQHCPPGTSWSQQYYRCDTRNNDKCTNAQRKASVKSAVGECPAHDGEYPVYLPDNEDCSIFYECSNGRAIKLQCAPGDLFDAPSGKCVKNTDATCQNSSGSKKTKTLKPEGKPKVLSVVGECPKPSGSYPVYLPDDEDCSAFYECSNGIPIKLFCADGTLFDSVSRVCKMASEAKCQNSSK